MRDLKNYTPRESATTPVRANSKRPSGCINSVNASIFSDDPVNSKVKLFMVEDQYQLAKFIKNTIFGKKIVVGMGAGTISTWMRQLPELI